MQMVNIDYKLLIKSFLIFSIILISTSCYDISVAQVKAFPGAEGFGTDTVHGRGGRVLHVTNLNATGTGSLRAAAEASGPRIVVFDVSGIIDLGSDPIIINDPYIYIAGQTAPGGGICLKRSQIIIKTHDVVIRFIRSRPGDESGGNEPENRDAHGIAGGTRTDTYNIVIDHCSFSWGIDENAQNYGNVHDITWSWNIFAEGLCNAGHPNVTHSKGLITGGDVGSTVKNISIHHNAFISNDQRNPFIKLTQNYDIVNNVIYNWGQVATHINYTQSYGNIVKNYWKRGPDSTSNECGGWNSAYEIHDGSDGNLASNSLYLYGNLNDAGDTDWDSGMTNVLAVSKSATRFTTAPITEMAVGSTMIAWVLDNSGAIYPSRDSVDTRLVGEVRNGTGDIIDSQAEVGGWPSYVSGTPPLDTDQDGMPDAWETSNGLNPSNPSDGPQDRNEDGYTNVEEYINSLASSPLPKSMISTPREFQKL